MKLLEISKLCIDFPSRNANLRAVDDVSISLRHGEILGIVGESGAGKSTIGNAIVGLLEPPGKMTAGTINLLGKRLDTLSETEKQKIRGRKIGMIFQDPLTSLDPLQTVEKQLVETIDFHLDLGPDKARQRAVELISKVGIEDPELRIKQFPHQFSGGMRQRVVIALALCANPELIIADEPTTALDVSIQAQILDLIKYLCKKENVGIILVTHDMGVIANTTDRVAVMYKGALVETGLTEKILSRPDHPYTKSLISAVPRSDKKIDRFPAVTYIEGDKDRKKLIELKNHWLGQKRDFDIVPGPLIKLENTTMRFTTKSSIFPKKRIFLNAVDNVTLDINNGEVLGLVGESGSGKSTLARLICGLYRPFAGNIWFSGQSLTALKRPKELDPFRRQIQMIFQDPFSSLNPRMRVADIIAEPIYFHKLANKKSEIKDIVIDLIEHVGLDADAAVKFPHEFSGGQRQRISIARALATRPRFLICDEPTSALDVSIQAQILNLLKDLQKELGLTILFISHDLPVIRQMCDRIGVMRLGKLCELKETEELFSAPTHEYTKHLLSLMPKTEFFQPNQVL